MLLRFVPASAHSLRATPTLITQVNSGPARLSRSFASFCTLRRAARTSCINSTAIRRKVFIGISMQRRGLANGNGNPKHQHEHEEEDDHGHGHSHSIFGGHSHDHSHDGSASQVVEVLSGRGDRGSYITVVGLLCNVGLTATKGLAGWYLHSASLLADAGHSASDLLGDFITLICWKLSRRPPSAKYPHGFGKFETLGTTTVSLLLIGGALAIGFHSYTLLYEAMTPAVASIPPGPVHDVLNAINSTLPDVSSLSSHGHSHGDGGTLDPNAAWFALASVGIKEWLYRITKRVADDEKSSVLLANAIHHRSDAYSSLVALFAILGSYAFPALPLDPIGGLVVSFVILGQGMQLMLGAFGEMTDASVPPRTLRSISKILSSAAKREKALKGVHNLRAIKAGALVFVDFDAHVDSTLSLVEASTIEDRLRNAVMTERAEIKEVRIRLLPDSSAA